MKTILKYITRNIKEKKGRSLLIIISLLIASCVMILNLVIPKQIVEEDKNKIRNLVGESDILIAQFENFNIKDLKLPDNEAQYVGVNNETILHKDKTVVLYGTDVKKASKLNLIKEIDLAEDEIIISETTAKKFDYKENDIMKIEVGDNTYELKIASIAPSKGLLYFKSYVGVLNNATFNKIYGTSSDTYVSYYLDVKDNEKIDDYYDYLLENNKDVMIQKIVDEDQIKESNNYTSTILMVIFVMSVIMIFFVVSTLNKMIIMERTPVIATFRSIGATKKKMNGILVLENVMYGLIGGVLGAITSIFINRICIRLLTNGLNSGSKIPFSSLIIGILFSILLEIIMSIGAIIKSNKYSIKELMFDNPNSKYEISKKNSVLSVLCIVISIALYLFTNDKNIILDLLKVSLFWIGVANAIPLIMMLISNLICAIAKKSNKGSLILAGKNLGYNKMIISSSRLVVIAIAVMLVILNISATFDKILDSFSYQFSGYDIFIRDTSKLYTEYEKLNDLDEVKEANIDFMNMIDVYHDNDKLDSEVILLGIKDSRADIEEYNYKIKDLKENEMLMDEKLLNNNNLKIGDKVTIKGNSDKEFTIVGTINAFYYSVQRDIAIINQNYFKENISKVPFQVVISVNDKYDVDSVVEKIERELKDPDITIMTVDEFIKSQRQNIHTIMYLFYIIIGLALVLSFVGIINNQIISFMERTKEMAVLNSVCMSKSQLNKMLVIENLTSNIVATILGFGVSIVSVELMNSVLNGIKMYINVKFDMSIALVLMVITLIILFTTVIIPIRRLKNINVVETIKYE